MSEYPAHVMASGVLVWDETGRLLLVKTHHREELILPGGLVEKGESPAEAARREVAEELGLKLSLGRLLAVQYLGAQGEIPSTVQFVFDSEPAPGTPGLRLQEDEIAEAFWLAPAEALARLGVRGRERVGAALAARAGTPVQFLDRTY